MAIEVKFDLSNNPIPSRLILATRSGGFIRELPIEQIVFHDTLVSGSEFSFVVYKANCVDANGAIDNAFWRKITDFKLVYCPEYDMWYEISVKLNEKDDTAKTCEAKSLGEAELSQVNVYGIEVNTEDDILRDDYEPTVIYNASHPEYSLIDRLLEKAPHYRVAHVDASLANIQRTFQFDGTSIYDAFLTVEKELNCLFVLECRKTSSKKIDRKVSLYDLENCCNVCGGRSLYDTVCPYCGSTSITPGYGENTSIYVDKDNLTNDITYSTDVGSVKNCFRLEAGDDLMTATVMNCNPNGSQYIWYITEAMREDMSSELQARLQEYETLYDYMQNENSVVLTEAIVTEYNRIVNKYVSRKTDLQTISSPIVGYPALMDAYYNTIDLQLYLNSGLMPATASETHAASTEAAKLTAGALSPVAVANLSACTEATAANAVLGMAKCLVSPDYQVTPTTTSYNTSTHKWKGHFTLTNYSDETDTADSSNITVTINEDMKTYIDQKLKRAMKQRADESTDVVTLFNMATGAFTTAICDYSMQGLLSLRDACQAALDILIQQGVADQNSWANSDSNLYDTMYTPYLAKMSAIEAEISVRSQELAIVAGVYDDGGGLLFSGMQSLIMDAQASIHDSLNFENFLGTTLFTEFASYRREDSFSDSNFISDGLNNEEMFEMARQFLEVAQKELYASATLQHSISAEMHNLLAIQEFHPLVNKFAVGNWIRLGVDNSIYRLRLSEYTIKYDDISLDVEFTDVREGYNSASDIQSILQQASSMSTSYGAVARQAKRGDETAGLMNNWVNEGFSLTAKLVGGADHQEFIIDDLGITGREYIPETDSYTDEQIRVISHGLYVTNDGWLTAKAGVGKFQFYNPRTRQVEEAFGVIADTLVGNLILSQNVGIYNVDNTVEIGEDGLVITTETSANTSLFTIRRKVDGGYEPIMYIDNDGYVVLNGSSINISAGEGGLDDFSLSSLRAGYNELQNTVTNIVADNQGLFVRVGNLENEDGTPQDSITTITGYTFNADGLTIRKSNEEMENLLDNTGMHVRRYTGTEPENILIADNDGVNALNLTARQYLIVGSNSRFEDFSSGSDTKRTGCFYIGG